MSTHPALQVTTSDLLFLSGGWRALATNFLGRKRLYYTEPMAGRFEASARSNLSNEIRALSA